MKLFRGFQDPDNGSQGLPWIQKDPDAKKDYQRDFADAADPYLDSANGETLSVVTWHVFDEAWTELTGQPGELKVSSVPAPARTATTATAWLEGGTVGQKYFVTCRYTTSLGRQDDDSFQVRCVET